MTLKEKFWEIIKKPQTDRPTELELIADDYAIVFAEWVINNRTLIKYQDKREYSELLEIFKKEKGW